MKVKLPAENRHRNELCLVSKALAVSDNRQLKTTAPYQCQENVVIKVSPSLKRMQAVTGNLCNPVDLGIISASRTSSLQMSHIL